MSNEDKEQAEKLLQIMRDAMQKDQALREKYLIGEKFRFIRDRLSALHSRVEENLALLNKEKEELTDVILEDEEVVYVYLYNAQGLILKTWQKMLNPAVFYEYSVNRPIYTDKNQIDTVIRHKANKNQHAYLAVIIKKEDVLKPLPEEIIKDAFGNIIIKVREGSLSFKKMISFTHLDSEYVISEEGELVKKIKPS